MSIPWGVVSGGRVPASRGAFRLRIWLPDIAWAFISPVVALYLSQAYVLHLANGTQTVLTYCLLSFAFSAVALVTFRVQDGMVRYFSAYDAIEICKAAIGAELTFCVTLFSLTRLDGIPRSAPIIHALILAAGLVATRALARIMTDGRSAKMERNTVPEHVIVIGSNRFSSFYIKLLRDCAPSQQRIVALLDKDPRMVGRAIEGVRIVGLLRDLEAIIDEYALHGINIERVVLGGEPDIVSDAEMREIRRVCENRGVVLRFAPHLLGLREIEKRPREIRPCVPDHEPLVLPAYFKLKYIIDFCAAAAIVIMLLPLFAVVSIVVFFDVGSPLLFWQQRIGLRGRSFLLYKFRTLRPPFDWRGQPIPDNRRLSSVGQLMRATSLDELPQLLNVLVGDMSLIGPRPLLPEDQPANSAVRLMVRPGITGWAQVNGGKLLTADEKQKLDKWYIQNASISLDLRIVLRTLRIMLLSAREPSSIPGDADKFAIGCVHPLEGRDIVQVK
jgi:lipopolysaccharide/colanic/teichoic acid biosynthesis glycosyltransferase